MPRIVYHYTSEDSLERIKRSGYISESLLSGVDAAFGRGVYVTTLSPEEGRKKIADNNWGPLLGPQKESDGKVDRAIKLWIPDGKLQQADSDRDVWIHVGNVVLGDYDNEFVDLTHVGECANL